jgi:hypothetical protein
MRFKFCGDLDAPDFLLKEIDTLSKISVVRIKLIVAAIVKGLVGDEIDVCKKRTTTCSYHTTTLSLFQFEKVDSLVQKSNLTSGDVKGAVAGLDFILQSGCKYNVSDETLSLELNQLGLPKEHCEALAKVYQANKEAMQARLRARRRSSSRDSTPRARSSGASILSWLPVRSTTSMRRSLASISRCSRPTASSERSPLSSITSSLRVLLQELREAKAIVDSVAQQK